MKKLKYFNLKEIIKERVNLEAEVEYSKTPNPPLSKYKLKKDKKNLIFWWNLSKTIANESVNQLMP